MQVALSGIWTHIHWIPFRRRNRLSYQAINATRTQSQLCTAILISLSVQCLSVRFLDYLKKISIKINVATAKAKSKWNLTLNKRWNWSSCTKLALRASWTHDLIAQSVEAFERNLVGRGLKSHSGQFSIATSKNPSVQCWIPYIYISIHTYIYILYLIKKHIFDFYKYFACFT